MKTQRDKVLEALETGKWVSGRYFLHTLMLSQYHARIWELQKQGYDIEASPSTDEFGFKSYRLIPEVVKETEEPIINNQSKLFEAKHKIGTYGAYKEKLI